MAIFNICSKFAQNRVSAVRFAKPLAQIWHKHNDTEVYGCFPLDDEGGNVPITRGRVHPQKSNDHEALQIILQRLIGTGDLMYARDVGGWVSARDHKKSVEGSVGRIMVHSVLFPFVEMFSTFFNICATIQRLNNRGLYFLVKVQEIALRSTIPRTVITKRKGENNAFTVLWCQQMLSYIEAH